MRIAIILSVILLATRGFAAPARNESSCMWNADVPPVVEAARFVIFGEIRGTNEIPATVGEFVCRKSARASSVVLGLEIPEAEQASIDRYLSSAGMPGEQRQLVAGAFW